MKSMAIVIALALVLPSSAHAQTTLTVDPATITNGYLNVFNLPAPDGDGAFQFGSPWGFADLTAVFNGDELTLGPNSIDDPDVFWYIGGGAPGNPGNKITEANSYAEFLDGSLAGQTVLFRFRVLSNTFTDAHTVRAFIRDFAPDFSSVNEQFMDVDLAGDYEVTLATVDDAARPVQVGFQVTGVNVWVTDREPFGSIVIAPWTVVSDGVSSFGGIKALFED